MSQQIEINEHIVKEYYSRGYCIKEIHEKLNIDMITIYNIVSKGHKITTENERIEMINLRNKGWSISAIARKFNKSRACVRLRLQQPAKIGCNTPVKLSDEQISDIGALSKENHVTGIAKKLGLNVSCIRRRLEHFSNLPKRKVSEKELQKFIELFEAGYTHAKIAEECHRSEKTVGAHLRAAGYYRLNKRK